MKNLIYILSLITLVCCGTKQLYSNKKLNKELNKEYTNITFFDCNKQNDFVANSDEKKLIFEILSRAVVEERTVPGYASIRDKTKIYVLDTYFSNLKMGYKGEYKKLLLDDIPTSINNVQFCLKSKEELQEIANKTSDFMYLSIGNIGFRKNDKANIGIANLWVLKNNNFRKSLPLSGGGYILTYKKVGNNWIYDEDSMQMSWQS